MEYTKGPWMALQGDENIDYEIWTTDGQSHICGLERLNEEFLPLFLAAPAMYEALKAMQGIYKQAKANGHDYYFETWLNYPDKPEITPLILMDKALSKAEGKEV